VSRSNAEFDVISTLGGLKELGPLWDPLAGKFPTPLLSHDWFYAAASALHADDELHVIVKTSERGLRAAAPMVKRRRNGFTSLEIIGCDMLREPSGLLYREPSDLRGILGRLTAPGLPLYFGPLADPILVAELSSVRGVDDRPGRRIRAANSPWIRIDGSWDEYYRGIASSWRSAHRRARKKADEAGNVEFEFHSPGSGNFDALMAEFVRVEGEGWKGRLGTALRVNTAARRFFETYGRAASAQGKLRLAFMRVDGKAVAAQFAVECCRRYWLLKIGYDEMWSFCSPGILLMYAALERAFSLRLDAFEFLGNDEPWIKIWNHRLHRYHSRTVDPSAGRRMVSRAVGITGRIRRRVLTRLARRTRKG